MASYAQVNSDASEYKRTSALWKQHGEKFSTLKNNQDRVTFLVNLLSTIPQTQIKFIEDCKSDHNARILQKRGIAESETIKAVEIYTKSLSQCKTVECLIEAYKHRSASLWDLKLFQECLFDTQKALDLLESNNLDLKRRECDCLKVLNSLNCDKPFTIRLSSQNDTIQYGSACIEIQNNSQFGRHILATRDINPGEILAVDKPFACLLTKGTCTVTMYCHQCAQRCFNLMPCENCTMAMFCSEDCKSKNSHLHRYECKVWLSLVTSYGSWFHYLLLGVRMTFKALMLTSRNTIIDDQYRSDRYEEIGQLVSHIEKLDKRELFHWTYHAAQVVIFMKKYNSDLIDDNFGQLLLRNMRICNNNTVALTDQGEKFGCGIYSLFSLFNHSCCPNAQYCTNNGFIMVVQAKRTIKKGEQCFVCYGYHYKSLEREERQERLQALHFFKCHCQACEENWPMQSYK